MNVLFIHEIDWVKKIIFEPHHLSEIFSMKGHNVFVIDCKEPNSSDLIKNLKTQIIKNFNKVYDDASITLIHPPSLLVKGLNRATSFLSCKKIIHDTVIQNNIDIIFLYGVPTNGLQSLDVAHDLNIPIVFRELDISHQFIKVPILKQLTKIIEKNVISNATKVYSCTPGLQKYSIQMGAQEKNSEYFPLGVNTHVFKPTKKDNVLAKSLGIKNTDTVLIFVGTLYPFSGLEYLIENFSIIQNRIPQIKLLIVGGGPNYHKIKNLVTKQNLQNFVILTNFVSQKILPCYIGLADLCLNPFETNEITNKIIPTKIIEYMACKKPVLSTPLLGTKELLPSENYGIVYSELIDFPNTIIDLLFDVNHLSDLSEHGYDYSHKNHDWSVLSDTLISKLEKLISK
jgi:glycosyltransferase involved in cell wall biosynthesis